MDAGLNPSGWGLPFGSLETRALGRTLGTYLVASAAALGHLDLLFARFGLPEWLFTAAVYLLITGLVVVVVTALHLRHPAALGMLFRSIGLWALVYASTMGLAGSALLALRLGGDLIAIVGWVLLAGLPISVVWGLRHASDPPPMFRPGRLVGELSLAVGVWFVVAYLPALFVDPDGGWISRFVSLLPATLPLLILIAVVRHLRSGTRASPILLVSLAWLGVVYLGLVGFALGLLPDSFMTNLPWIGLIVLIALIAAVELVRRRSSPSSRAGIDNTS